MTNHTPKDEVYVEIDQDNFRTEPHIRYISKFSLKRTSTIPSDMSIREYADRGEYSFQNITNDKYFLNDYCAKFPVIIQKNGEIWKLSNVYIISYMLSSSDITGNTLKSIALDLLDYYKFVSERNLDIFYFPKLNRHRVTYQYRSYLLNEVIEGRCKKNTASRRINRIIDFYERLLTDGFISHKLFDNQPYEIIIKTITLNNSIGLEFNKTIRSSNLAIPTTKKNLLYDTINDDGILRPLTSDQQKIFLEYLEKYGSRQLQLICVFSLLTGARIQTVCTLRVHHIKDLIKKNLKDTNNNYILNTGGNTGIDTKKNKELCLKVPDRLVQSLNNYINSKAWYERALKSFYSGTENSYVFTTKSGLPYYTSLSEIIEIKNDIDRPQLTIRRGEAVRKSLEELITIIRKNHEDYTPFTFHDLRATFGMNFLKYLLDNGVSKDKCFLFLKEAMGHSNIETTLSYLNYQDVMEQFSSAQEKLEFDLFGNIFNE
ncbi:tyrosine-type recombinase/integrase [Acinetobacter soli]|uniref:tyrosine-type recombinase/integrase n=1 Tax=Acinetobacter soli TaxID=487316 RepID=UPI000DD05461|nr:site-specific integrase [Acinetobacter soli]